MCLYLSQSVAPVGVFYFIFAKTVVWGRPVFGRSQTCYLDTLPQLADRLMNLSRTFGTSWSVCIYIHARILPVTAQFEHLSGFMRA